MIPSFHDQQLGRRKVYMGLALAILLCSTSQVCWKYATSGIANDATAIQVLLATCSRPIFWVACGLYIWQFFNWMVVLKHADLSFAQPITAVSYVAVGLSAWLIFKEPMPPQKIAGISLILLGVYFISRTPHKTYRPKPAPVVLEPAEQLLVGAAEDPR